ncbi:MAG: hypothetical protein JOZ62_20600 [Acidobacteriaceae bacterium]|nr:hypothetical protein [Acidobacteriaceae bacterium]
MRFFVPLSRDPHHGEHVYNTLREQLTKNKEPVADKRIYALKFHEDGKRRTLAVGDEFHRFGDGPVLAIFQGDVTSTYYICTPKHGGFEGEPVVIGNHGGAETEEFSALA